MTFATSFLARPLSCLLAIATTCALASAADRTAYVTSELQAQNASLSSALRTEKYQAMEPDAFSFYRGSNHLFWKDKGQSSALSTYGNVAATRVWLQGDMHINNMGSFANDQNTLVFDANDFDEAVLGDYQLDLWRLNVSLVLMMRVNGGFSSANEATVVDACTESYLDTIELWKAGNGEATKTYTAANTYGQLDDFLVGVAADKTTKKLLDKYTAKNGSGVRYFSPAVSVDIATVPASTVTEITGQMANYGATLSGGKSYSTSFFKVKSVALRLHAGVGSLGTTRYYVLIEGSTTGQDDDIILDVKAQKSPSAYLNLSSAAITATNTASGSNHAKRVVTAAKALGNYVDDYLGWMTLSGQIYSVRQRSPQKDSLDTTLLNSLDRATKMAEQYGAILATAHARADKDANAVNVTYNFDLEVFNRINGWHDQFRAAQRAVVLPYADQVVYDYNSFLYARSIGSL